MNLIDRVQYFDNKKLDDGMVTQAQIVNLITHTIDVFDNNIEGDIVELGCNVGESSKYLTKTLLELESDKKVWVYDSFEGLPEQSKHEEGTIWYPGTMATTMEVLINNFKINNLPVPIICKGWFKDIPKDKLPEKIALAFLDGDFYTSIYDSLEKIYDKISDGGYILFHDYGRDDLPGVKAAIMDWFNERDIILNIKEVCPSLGVIQKNKKMTILEELIEKYGTDKSDSSYTKDYEEIFTPLKDEVTSILEIGIGTLQKGIPSTFSGNLDNHPHYKPGGSLRAWRDFFPNAQIHGVDIAEDCLFEEERINTYLFDSSDPIQSNYQLRGLEFDIIIDDGNHHPKYQIKTLKNLWPKLKEGGVYIIEDLGGFEGNIGEEDFFSDHEEEFKKIIGNSHYVVGSLLVIYKGASVPIHSTNSPKNYTLVTGLWDLNRDGRGFEEHYLPNFEKFLKIDANMVIFVPKSLENFVRKRRSNNNTFIKIYELEDIKNLYSPHWDKTQQLRTDENWLNITGKGGWLRNSPQAKLEYYNPIVMSKMSMLNESVCWNPFDTDYFFWLDAGITNTVSEEDLIKNKVLDKLPELGNPFLFVSYPYKGEEIHGFKTEEIVRLIGTDSEYVCRGGLFGGHKEQIRDVNNTYYHLLSDCLKRGYMGTEETIFTIMSYLNPLIYQRYMIDTGGMIQNFIDNIKNGTAIPVETSKSDINYEIIGDSELKKWKTNLYVLTFNSPKQLMHTIKTMKKTPEWLEKPNLFLIDNSTNEKEKTKNKAICQEYNFEYIDAGGNTGICGGRQIAAEHFDKSDSDFMFFFEDDMTSNSKEEEGQFCRNGFRKYIPNLYNLTHQIMLREGYDFLKLSFTEVYMDNNIQTSWYNVPQDIRDKYWPNYNSLPVHGIDPHSPKTKFNNIKNMKGLSYIDGEIYYANWPMIVSKEGNRKMFLDTKWNNPFEQTWMSYIYQETKHGNIKPSVLLASPIWHDRIVYYKDNERREN